MTRPDREMQPWDDDTFDEDVFLYDHFSKSNEGVWIVAIIGFGLLMAALALAMLFFRPANAHSFYSGECCSSVRITPDGYEWNLNGEVQLFKWQDHRIRYSPDGKYHGCVLSTGTRRCLYVPPQGS